MQAIFENQKIKVILIDRDDLENKSHIFKIEIKEFDTPVLNIEYDESEDAIITTWIEDDVDSAPKGHVIYKLFSLIEFEVCEIIKFIIKHM
jgi:hypothetical protein